MQPVSIVLLGGIASGKSRVASLFEELGARILDADSIAHELLKTDEVRSLIRTTFGAEFIADNKVDRKKLASDVFSDKDKLKTLEGILHPRVFTRLTEETQKLSTMKTRQVVLFDVPLAAETGMLDSVDLVVFVDTDEAIRIKRAVETRGWTAEELLRRERNQWPLDKKREAATHTVRNSQTVAEAREDVRRIWNQSIQPKLEEN
ncbi:MAG: dephospho-CoA kinase [Planctomycetota bacterium]|nr:dephospho-CoA kinase [Planctomycetota bacterium]